MVKCPACNELAEEGELCDRCSEINRLRMMLVKSDQMVEELRERNLELSARDAVLDPSFFVSGDSLFVSIFSKSYKCDDSIINELKGRLPGLVKKQINDLTLQVQNLNNALSNKSKTIRLIRAVLEEE